MITDVIKRLAAKRQLRVEIGAIRPRRWDTITLRKLSIESERYPIAFAADAVQIRFGWNRAQWKRPLITAIKVTRPHLRLRPAGATRGKPAASTESPAPRRPQPDYYKGLNGLLRRFAYLIPREASCTELSISLDDVTIGRTRSITSSVAVTSAASGETSIRSRLQLDGCWVDSAKIAPSPFELARFDIDARMRVSDQSFTIEDGSTGTLDALRCRGSFDHRVDEKNVVTASFRIEPATAEEILRSLPFVRHGAITGIRATGRLGVESRLSFSMKDRRHHQFSAKLIKDGFAITSPGTQDLSYLKGPFNHDVYDNGVLLRQIHVGSSNPDFVPLGELPSLLLNTIFFTEDPEFYKHHGINEANIGWAIVANVRYKKFLRGGSTITMQLARNLFLGHKKNVARKTEETILAWLLEDFFQIPKDRLLEIYFNIIELAPNVYGIAEGCRYYFGKHPRDLTLEEILVLSYIIPRPKFFPEAVLLESPTMMSKLRKHFAVYGDLLLQGGHIDDARLRSLSKEIRFDGSLGTLRFG